MQLKRSIDVLKNDILLAIVGATLGKVAIVEKMEPFTIQRSLAVFRPIPELMHFKYLAYFFQSYSFQRILWKNAGFSAQPGIYLESLKNFHCGLPSIQEQQQIVIFLDSETERIDLIISRIDKEIVLLQEYRTALISEVVTGKIDVRDHSFINHY
ncbi:Type I restriction modification DNA specificity domain protein [uncultured archaeon]|nr:Type I restriction modification DNA specificity domain protein [uncultured archaeon]